VSIGPASNLRAPRTPVDNGYRNRLSSDIQQFVEEIEAAVGFEIMVEVRAPENEARQQGRRTLKCEVDPHGARIIIPEVDHFPETSVLHELLHIRRFLVEKVPRLIICDDYEPSSPEFEQALTGLDNSIEHLIIVPKELAMKPERESYWVRIMRRALDELRTDCLSVDDQKRMLLQHGVFVTTVLKDPQLAADFGCLVEHFSIPQRAAAILTAVQTAVHSKEQLAKAFVTQLNLPCEAVCLEYIDSTNGASHEISILQVE
jgi:hypothetical protein